MQSAIAWRRAGSGIGGVDDVVFYDKPFLKFERLVETYLAFPPHGFSSFRMAIPLWLREKLFLKDLLSKELKSVDGARLERQPAVQRAPPQPRGERVLSRRRSRRPWS